MLCAGQDALMRGEHFVLAVGLGLAVLGACQLFAAATL